MVTITYNFSTALAGLPNLPDWLASRPYLTGDFVKSLDLPPPVCKFNLECYAISLSRGRFSRHFGGTASLTFESPRTTKYNFLVL